MSVCDLSDPVPNGPASKLFSREAFELMESVLSPDGTFVVQAGSVSPAEMLLHIQIVNAVSMVFKHTVVYSLFVPSFFRLGVS